MGVCGCVWVGVVEYIKCKSLSSNPQREIANSFASNASLVHKQVVRTDEGRKRYAEQVSDITSSTTAVPTVMAPITLLPQL